MGAETLYGDGLLAPLPTLLAGGAGAILAAPAPTMAGGSNDASASVPIPTIVSNDGNVARNTVSIPTLVANDFPYALLTVSAPTLEAIGLTGAACSFVQSVPAPSIIATGLAGGVLTVVESAPLPILTGVLDNPAIITFASEVAAAQLTATGLTGEVSSAELSALAPIMEAAGYPAFTVTFAGSTPAPRLTADLIGTLPETYRTWVLNLRTAALTEYDFAFTSYTIFDGKVLAVNGNGVVELGTQGLDNATAISARARTGEHDYESSLLKRLPRAYLNYSGGEMIYRSITAEGGTRSYALHDSFVVGIEQRRIPIGKGPKSRTWQHEIENVAGSDFMVDGLLVYPVTLRRRVQ